MEVNRARTAVLNRMWNGRVGRWNQDLRAAHEAFDRDGEIRRWFPGSGPSFSVDVSGVQKTHFQEGINVNIARAKIGDGLTRRLD